MDRASPKTLANIRLGPAKSTIKVFIFHGTFVWTINFAIRRLTGSLCSSNLVNKTFRCVSVPCNSVYTQNLNYSQFNIVHGTFNNFSHTVYCKFCCVCHRCKISSKPIKRYWMRWVFFFFFLSLSNKIFLTRKLKVTDKDNEAMPIWSSYGFSWRNKSNVTTTIHYLNNIWLKQQICLWGRVIRLKV